ncbi:MAG: tRNA pseudouridine(55) synthase TruB [Anaerolineae bacterium]
MSPGSQDLSPSNVSGILNINKPAGMTSHDVVMYVRRLTGQRKVGHAGTLDPMATGVLLLCLGQATRVAEYLMAGRKRYRAVVRLGVSTDTYDAEGVVTRSVHSSDLSQAQILDALAAFQGTIQQVPPPFSAIRQNGQRLYELARRGISVQAPPRTVQIHSISLVAWEAPDLTLDVTCSPGTYIRSLAHDLGQRLGVGGHLTALTRRASGQWVLENAVTLDNLKHAVEGGDWLTLLHPLEDALQDFERVDLPADLVRRVSQGQIVELDRLPKTRLVRAYAPDGLLVAVLRPSRKPGLWQPKKVFMKPDTSTDSYAGDR